MDFVAVAVAVEILPPAEKGIQGEGTEQKVEQLLQLQCSPHQAQQTQAVVAVVAVQVLALRTGTVQMAALDT